MTAEGTPGTSADGNNNTEGQTGDGTQAVDVEALKAERDELEKKHNKAFAELRTLKNRLSELETERNTRDRQAAGEKGDIDALRKSFQAELEDREKAINGLKTQLHTVTVEKEVMSIAARHAVDAGDVYALIKDRFTIGEGDSGSPVAVVKDSPLTPEQFIVKFLETKPHLAKNPRKAGSDATGNNAGSTHKQVSIAELAKEPDGGRKRLLEDPDLARKVLRGQL